MDAVAGAVMECVMLVNDFMDCSFWTFLATVFSVGEPPESATAAGAASGNNERHIPVDLTGTSDCASYPPDGERPPPGSGDSTSRGYLDSVNLFLTAPLDGEQGVTVHRRRGQGSQISDSGSALWATAPSAGNVSFGDHPYGDISASEADVWLLLRTSEGAWQAERDEYRWALRHMEQDMEHLCTALAQARQGQGIPGQPVPQLRQHRFHQHPPHQQQHCLL
uniref:Uncharacterized protein n=1 Tax=Sphaerodactylus townsendi TaxID=933632 RepID=A0ACB8F834_9SAUR